eukprot:COSAG06_NODE_49249_length_326_cov_2.233480_1_plen_39_part_01
MDGLGCTGAMKRPRSLAVDVDAPNAEHERAHKRHMAEVD